MALKINEIHEGDCLELMKDIPNGSVDMILCDLPYGTTAIKWDSIINFEELWKHYERVIKEDGAIVLTATQPFSSMLITSNLDLYKYSWIWAKNTASGFALAKRQPLRYYEEICVFYKSQPTYNPEMIPRTEGSAKRTRYSVINGGGGEHLKLERRSTKYDPNYKYPSNVIHFNSVPNSKGKLHPTQKPVALFEYLIRTYTNEGEVVLDNCIGSGTTAVAAINTDRQFIGIEKELEYVEIARQRVDEVKTDI